MFEIKNNVFNLKKYRQNLQWNIYMANWETPGFLRGPCFHDSMTFSSIQATIACVTKPSCFSYNSYFQKKIMNVN